MAERHSDGVGAKLREARERRGVSLRQIANATKISLGILEALERNDIARLPGGIFSRAFVRAYAVEVGLEPEALIQEFLAQFPHDSVSAGHPTSARMDDNVAIESDRRTASAFLWLMLISVPIAGLVVYFGGVGRSSVSSPRVTAGRLAVSLSAIGPCRVLAMADGQPVIDGPLERGDHRQLSVMHELVLTISDPSALVVTINGAETRSLGHAGEVVTAHVTVENFKDYLVHR